MLWEMFWSISKASIYHLSNSNYYLILWLTIGLHHQMVGG